MCVCVCVHACAVCMCVCVHICVRVSVGMGVCSLIPRPPPQLLSIAVRKARRRPGRVSHVVRVVTVIKRHPFKTTMY